MNACLKFAVVVSACLLASCSSHQSAPRDPLTRTDTPTTGRIVGRPTFDTTISVPGSNTLITPFAVRGSTALFQDSDPYTAGGVAKYPSSEHFSRSKIHPDSYSQSVRWHNAIITNCNTGSQTMLLTQRGIIGAWQPVTTNVRNPDQSYRSHTLALLFLAVLDDTNRSGEMDNLDARVAIATGPAGENSQVISPTNAQVWSMTYDDEKKLVLLTVAHDTNTDGRFDFNDVAVPYVWKLGSGEKATPLIQDSVRAQVESLLK